MNKSKGPLISVIIPSYNHAQYLGRALKSIQLQTYTNWEVIIIDNYSTDHTEKIIESYSDFRIHFERFNNNGIIAASRNLGIKLAKGEWVAFLDSDDWWSHDKLNLCMNNFTENVDIIYHDLKIFRDLPLPFARRYIHSRKLKPPVIIDLLVNGNAIGTSSVVVRRKLLNEINGMDESPQMVGAEDYNCWLKISRSTNNFLYLKNLLGFYQWNNLGVSRKNMSEVTMYATNDFLCILNKKQKLLLDANLRYTKVRFNFVAHHYLDLRSDLFFILKNGRSYLVIKALWILILYQYKFFYKALCNLFNKLKLPSQH
jgi:glycosyltransferase involved in cell wall biosynthesis